jgi:hypothetical protein
MCEKQLQMEIGRRKQDIFDDRKEKNSDLGFAKLGI